MLDILHIADTQSYDVKTYEGNGLTAGTTNLTDWVQWTKPRGIKFIYILGLGGGGSGGGSDNTANSSGGGGGGGSGAQTTILLPEMFIPDVLYIQAGAGGKGLLINDVGPSGSDTFIAIEPYNTYTPNLTLLRARGGAGGGAGSGTAAGAGGVAGAASTIADMPLCRGAFTSLSGQNGGNGGAPNGVAPNINFPVNGLMVTGGAGGGGSNTASTGRAGGSIIKPLTLGETYYRSIIGGAGASGSSAGRDGGNGYSANFNIINVGGAGGGGAASGGARVSGRGGDAAVGAGGGGTGAGTASNPAIKGGEGGSGFVMILCW